MAYTPENNPYIPGDPYSYDLKWIVSEFNKFEEPSKYAEAAQNAADAASASEINAADSAAAARSSEISAANSALGAHNSEVNAQNIADNIADPINGIVTDWLQDNITITPGVTIDASLSTAGAAADAKATGDAIKSLRTGEELVNLMSPVSASVPSSPGYVAHVLDNPIPPGTYTFSAEITKTDYTKPCFLVFSKSASSQYGSNVILSTTIAAYGSGKRSRVTVTLAETCLSMRLCSMENASASSGYAAQYDNIMINTGTEPLYYVKEYGAVDSLVRANPYIMRSTGDNTDRTGEIQNALNQFGSVLFSQGDYHIKNLIIPPGKQIRGVNKGNCRLISDLNGSYAIRMATNATIENLTILGDENDLIINDTSTPGTNRGIEWSGSYVRNGIISNCIISNFDEAAVYLKDTGTPVDHNLIITNCFISNSFYGVEIAEDSEYNVIGNCCITNCYYGILNRGGNNKVSNCGIDSNVIGIAVNDDAGSNNGHGSISNCTINHNTGAALEIRSTGRMCVTGCNFWYNDVELNNTNGNIISACEFGTNANAVVSGGQCSIFSGCMFASGDTASRSSNTTAVLIGCYYRAGGVVSWS